TLKASVPNGFYTVVKRFSSKEEKQRIVARVIRPDNFESEVIGIENHLNYFHFKKQGIDENLAYGIAAYLNTTYVDQHFRTFNGHTQVNATDLRQLKYPSREKLIEIGRWAKEILNFIPENLDQRIMATL
ncbi:MAG TPA: SAM-dependent methyltransferase, partial [Bacteroidia bacterium]|nr:SAM-dependent methyltransferase [Bacteroidia bacterium]